MKNKNRLTPFLVISLIVLIWILIFVLIIKNNKDEVKDNAKKIKLSDGLVQELYHDIMDEDIIFYDSGEYTIDNLTDEYIISKSTRFMTYEDIIFSKSGTFILSDSTLDNAIKMAFGPNINYNLINIRKKVATEIEYEDQYLELDIHYDAKNKNYIGNYQYNKKNNDIKIYKNIVNATKDEYLNLYINYIFYKVENDDIYLCSNYKCENKEKINNLDKNVFKNKNSKKIIVSYKKAGDDVFYYYKNVIDK